MQAAAAEMPTAEDQLLAGSGSRAAAIRRLRRAMAKGGPHSAVDAAATTADPAAEPLAAALARALAARLEAGDSELPSAV